MPLSESYWSCIDQVKSDVEAKIVTLRNKEAMIEARVAAIGNGDLSKSFSELTSQLIKVRGKLAKDEIDAAREEMKTAFNLAGTILRSLFELDKLKGV